MASERTERHLLDGPIQHPSDIALIVDVGKGRHTGTAASIDHLFEEWIVELRRKGRSPNTIRGYESVYRHNSKTAPRPRMRNGARTRCHSVTP